MTNKHNINKAKQPPSQNKQEKTKQRTKETQKKEKKRNKQTQYKQNKATPFPK